MENAEENNARLQDNCMCNPVPDTKSTHVRESTQLRRDPSARTHASSAKRSLKDPVLRMGNANRFDPDRVWFSLSLCHLL